MEKELEQFREEVRRLRAGRRSGSLPFPETLRAFAVRYVEHMRQGGGGMKEAAQRLVEWRGTQQSEEVSGEGISINVFWFVNQGD